jgi:hypothetical protein
MGNVGTGQVIRHELHALIAPVSGKSIGDSRGLSRIRKVMRHEKNFFFFAIGGERGFSYDHPISESL